MTKPRLGTEKPEPNEKPRYTLTLRAQEPKPGTHINAYTQSMIEG